MEVEEAVRVLGGVASWGVLRRLTSRRRVEQAVAAGQIVRVSRGSYALPVVHDGLVLAVRASGVVCLTTAALSYGWEVKSVPDVPQVAVPKDRRLRSDLVERLTPCWVDLTGDDTEGYATSRAKTLEMCGRRLPFDEALAVADSALRHGFPATVLRTLAREARGPGAARLRRVAHHADARAANPFESVLRALALDVPGLHVEPQVTLRGDLGLRATPDLVDRSRRLVLEADSFEWHGDRAALRRDARRYDLLVANGWTVLRFSWEDVMHDQAWVRAVLEETVRRTERSGAAAVGA